MKFILLYSHKKTEFPSGKELQHEFKCQHVGDINGTMYDVKQNSKWNKVDPDLLHNFAFGFIKMHSDLVNKIWELDPSRKYYEGKCHLYLLSNDTDRKLIDWWSLKNEFSIRVFDINETNLNEALQLSSSSSAIGNAHQYSSAKHQRENLFKYHKLHFTNAEIAYLENLSVHEDKIEIKFLNMKKRLEKRIENLFKKSKWK